MFVNPDSAVPPHWLTYVGVDDIEASTSKARELGATVVRDVTEVGEYGWVSVIVDPAGAALALWKPRQAEAK